jgi:hypothetical protein
VADVIVTAVESVSQVKVAVMVVVPGASPVTTPSALTVAMLEALDDQMNPALQSTCDPSEVVTIAVSFRSVPGAMDGTDGRI